MVTRNLRELHADRFFVHSQDSYANICVLVDFSFNFLGQFELDFHFIFARGWVDLLVGSEMGAKLLDDQFRVVGREELGVFGKDLLVSLELNLLVACSTLGNSSAGKVLLAILHSGYLFGSFLGFLGLNGFIDHLHTRGQFFLHLGFGWNWTLHPFVEGHLSHRGSMIRIKLEHG